MLTIAVIYIVSSPIWVTTGYAIGSFVRDMQEFR